jgi:hypothetical protein
MSRYFGCVVKVTKNDVNNNQMLLPEVKSGSRFPGSIIEWRRFSAALHEIKRREMKRIFLFGISYRLFNVTIRPKKPVLSHPDLLTTLMQ